MKKKLLSALLILATALSTAACAADTTDSTDTTAADNAVDTTAVTTADDGLDRVPEMNFDGADWRVWTAVNDFVHGEINIAEEDGDLLNDTQYAANRALEERFNFQYVQTTSADVKDPKLAVAAGEDAYEIINIGTSTAITWATEGLTYIIDDLPYIDLDRPYWNQSINEALKINNKSYFAAAPFNLTIYDFAHAMLFNKKMITSFELDDPYAVVNDGTWTLAKFEEMTMAVTADINGDGAMDGEDRYGFLAQPKAVLPGFWMSCGESTIRKDEAGSLYFAAIGNERFISLIEKIFAITRDNGTWYVNESTTNYDDLLRNMFKNEKGLFFDTQVFHIEALRDMETDFGILPYPKYDETQDEYLTRLEGIYLFTVPVTSLKTEMSSAIIEAMACEFAQTVIPAYYDVSLKAKFARDDDSAAMLDIIFDGLSADYGDAIWAADIRDGIFRLMFLNDKRDTVSEMASIEEKINKLLEDTMDAYKALEK